MGIFAQVFHEVLLDHEDSDYSHLGGQGPRRDPIWHPLRRMAIPSQVISRLKEAAVSNDSRATLNPEDLEYIADQLGFSSDERRRLRAALLAQGVEIFLRERLSSEELDVVVTIAQTVYSTLLSNFDSIFHHVRGSFDEPSSRQVTCLALSRSLSDQGDRLAMEARMADEKGWLEEAQFWNELAEMEYKAAAELVQDQDPSVLADLTKKAQQTPDW